MIKQIENDCKVYEPDVWIRDIFMVFIISRTVRVHFYVL